jgi:Carboxypeptidase regulatory-like domain/TonB-dependent Receptor Plug Domain
MILKSCPKFLCLLAFTTSGLFAQFDSAEVLGTVKDNSGSAISKARMTLINQDTAIQAKTTSDDNGNFTFTNVKIGTYTVTAEAPGFSKAVANDVVVNVNARQRVDLTLQVGAVSDSVEVSGAASALQTDSSERGQIINTAQVVELPLNGRQYSDLALLSSGVIKSPSAYSGTPREGSFIVNGLRSVYNNYLMDGVDNNAYGTSNQGFSNQVVQPPPDAVNEFKVITNNYSAEYGRSGGATIDVAMRSGTNRFHGAAWDFLRNTDLNAIGYVFGARPATFKKPTLQQNQFGATIGGPIRKDKIFFFGDYEGFRSLQKVLNFDTIPSLNDRVGNLPVAVVNPQTGKVYPANTPIPTADVASFAQKVLGDLPAPTGPGRSNNYQQLLLNKNYNDKFDAKIDDQFNEKMSGFLRIGQRKVNIFNQPDIAGPSGGNSNGYTRVLNQQGVAAFNWVINSSSILETRFAVSRTVAGKQPPAIGGPSVLDLYGITGLSTDSSLTGGFTPSTLSGGFNALGRQSTNPQFQNPQDFDPKINFSKVIGRHALKIGYEFVALRIQVLDVNPLYGRDAYAGSFSKPTCAQLGQAAGCTVPNDAASYAVADFLFGLRSQYALGTDVVGNYRQHENFAYIQDDYKVSNKLSLNLGLRYEYATPMWERDNVLSNYDPATNSIIKAKDGSLYDRALVNPDRNNFAPRIGFAYSYDSKLVFRGGYGISYIHQNRVGSANELGINGPQVVIATVNQSNPLDPTFRTTQQGYPAGISSPANFNPVLSNITYIPKTLPDPYVQSWFFSIQRELARNTVLDVAYVANHSVALPVLADYNQALPQPTPTSNLSLQARRPNQSFGAITWYDPAGFSNYNSLQVKLEHRLSGGLYFLNAFTWSKAIDNSAQSLDTANGNAASPQDVRNMASEKGPSNYDVTLTNISSVVYQLPFGKGKKYGSNMPGVMNAASGGWELTAINTALSSPVINLRAWNGSIPAAYQVVGNLSDFRGGEAYRPNVTGDPLAPSGQSSTDNFFNKANVQLSTDPSHPFGNAGRNSVRAFPLNQLDLGIQKTFGLHWESVRLQFRSEFFNVFNHTNFQAPNSDVASSAFGTIRSTFPARQIQFALKLMF